MNVSALDRDLLREEPWKCFSALTDVVWGQPSYEARPRLMQLPRMLEMLGGFAWYVCRCVWCKFDFLLFMVVVCFTQFGG